MVLERPPFVTPVGKGHAVLGIKLPQSSRKAWTFKIDQWAWLYFGISEGHSLTEDKRDLGCSVALPVLKVGALLPVSARLMQGL